MLFNDKNKDDNDTTYLIIAWLSFLPGAIFPFLLAQWIYKGGGFKAPLREIRNHNRWKQEQQQTQTQTLNGHQNGIEETRDNVVVTPNGHNNGLDKNGMTKVRLEMEEPEYLSLDDKVKVSPRRAKSSRNSLHDKYTNNANPPLPIQPRYRRSSEDLLESRRRQIEDECTCYRHKLDRKSEEDILALMESQRRRRKSRRMSYCPGFHASGGDQWRSQMEASEQIRIVHNKPVYCRENYY